MDEENPMGQRQNDHHFPQAFRHRETITLRNWQDTYEEYGESGRPYPNHQQEAEVGIWGATEALRGSE